MKIWILVTNGVTTSSSTSSRFSGNCMAEPQAGNVILNEQTSELKRQKGRAPFLPLFVQTFCFASISQTTLFIDDESQFDERRQEKEHEVESGYGLRSCDISIC